MEDHRLRAFCLIVELQSFSKAASAKHITQSALSHLVKNLEAEVGVLLLNRSGRRVTTTSSGQLLYVRAKRILDQYRELDEELREGIQRLKGTVRIGASPLTATCLLPEALYGFARNNPDLLVDLNVMKTEAIVDALQAARIDVGFAEGNVRDTGIIADTIVQDKIIVIAADNHPLTKRSRLTVDDLMAQDFIMPESGSVNRRFIEDFLTSAGKEPGRFRVIMTLGSPDLVVQMVQAGLGIAFVSKWSAFKAIKEGSVKALPLIGKTLRRDFVLLLRRPDTLANAAKAFVVFLRGHRFFKPF